MIETELLVTAIGKLKSNFPELNIELKETNNKNIQDAKLCITVEVEYQNSNPALNTNSNSMMYYGTTTEKQKTTNDISLIIMSKKNLTLKVLKEPMLEYFINDKKKNGQKIMIITEYITSPIMDYLKDQKIFFADAAGNAFINLNGLYIFKYDSLLNKRNISQKSKSIFYSSGLKMIFNVLCNYSLINQNYKKIAMASAISVGSVKTVIDGLIQEGYALITNNKKTLINKDKLFRKWIDEYAEKLRPKLVIGKYKFKNFITYKNWKKISLPSETFWGGEAASELCNEHIRAEKLTIYTNSNINEIINEWNIVQDKDGYLEILKIFWDYSNPEIITASKEQCYDKNINIVPVYLRYADLIISENERNIGAAQIIYEKYISGLLK